VDVQQIAEEVLFPAAAEVDARGQIPAAHLDRLAAAGLYGPPDEAPVPSIAETLASGCLSTAFVWIQHLGALGAAASSTTPGLREAWLPELARGGRRAGIALGAVRPGPASVRATRVDGGYVFDGSSPWVTGWGYIDTVLTLARTDRDVVVAALLDAVAGDSLRVEPLTLAAVNASRTVHIRLSRHFVPDARVAGTSPYSDWPARDAAGLRLNGSLALGLADRCCRLGGLDALRTELDSCRDALDRAGPAAMPAARAAAAELAMRAAAALMVAVGARGVVAGEHAERLVREAAFLLVFGSRPGIRHALLERLAGARDAGAARETAVTGPAQAR
jgi:alkylation response protein AidB-like acyl-CoA dehydrogenase